MTCPRCRVDRDILEFKPLEVIEEYSEETLPIYKCPPLKGGCGWEFAPAETAVRNSMLTDALIERATETDPS